MNTTCPNCGTPIEPHHKYCPNCGHVTPRFAQTTARSQPAPTQQPVKKHGCWFWGFVVVAVGIVGFVGLLILAALSGPRAGKTAATTSTAIATWTPAAVTPSNTAAATLTLEPTVTPDPNAVASIDDVCVRASTMTDVQLKKHVESFVGKKVVDWRGYIFDVSVSGSAYEVQVAKEPKGFLWTRDIVLYGVPRDVAENLNVNQAVVFSGRIRRVSVAFGVSCNPLEIDNVTLTPQ